MGGFEFTPFDEGEFAPLLPWLNVTYLGDHNAALSTTVQWFLDNYDTARTGMNKK